MKRHDIPTTAATLSRHIRQACVLALWCAQIACLWLPVCQSAMAECVSPDLAHGLCDRNGDMLADAPDDKSQWLDPDPIMLADVAGTDMYSHAARAAPFILHLEKILKRKVSYFAARDYSDLLLAFKANRVHLININTGSVEQEVHCNGFVPIAQPIDGAGNIAGYQMEIVVPAASAIKSVRDLKGQKITFVDENSASGYKVPRIILAREFGLEAGKDYSFEFSGRQDSSIMGATNGVYQAVAIASLFRQNLLRDKLIEASALRVIFVSKTLPHSPWGVSYRLNPALAKRLQEAIVSYDGPENVLQNGARFKVANYKTDWAFMRELSNAAGTTFNCKK